MYFVRLSPIFFLLWGFLLLGPQACSPAPTCIGDVGTTTINPNGSPCDKRCDCNNQQYVGFCNDNNICESTARKDCSEKEEKQACTLLPIDAQENCNAGQQICQPAELTTQKWGDCKPVARTKAEDTPALCFDGLDNDCDGKYDKFDKDCASFCQPDSTRPCYTGDPKTRNRGICKLGTQTCNKDGKGYSACQDEVLPQKEECNGKDDNCDGKIDEGCQTGTCTDGDTQPCGDNTGTCTKGTQTCQNGQWGSCSGGVQPTAERCNGKDDDCDGQIDNQLDTNCYSGPSGTQGKGLCKRGTRECLNGKWTACQGEVTPKTEVCDGKDNDCDGQKDEGCSCKNGDSRSCGTDTGACKKGIQTCNDLGEWGPCTGGVEPKTETCGTKDLDCDGKIGCADPDCNGASCNDNNACTHTDKCSSGKCKGTAISCNSDTCTTRTCQGTNKCKITYKNGTACNDNNACTHTDRCSNGQCKGTAISCKSDTCMTRSCQGTSKCKTTPKTGIACGDDGNPCTSDVCNSSGKCSHPKKSDGSSCGANVFCCAGTCVDHQTNRSHCGGCYNSCGNYPCYKLNHTGICGCTGNSECRTNGTGPTWTCYNPGSGYRCNCQSDADCGPKQRCYVIPGHNFCSY
ncbi:MAG TPA: hypothetical protein DCE42_29990 [Myxococcales bacterium]|nr:hypothetical protein [Myxococcales bacterium]